MDDLMRIYQQAKEYINELIVIGCNFGMDAQAAVVLCYYKELEVQE